MDTISANARNAVGSTFIATPSAGLGCSVSLVLVRSRNRARHGEVGWLALLWLVGGVLGCQRGCGGGCVFADPFFFP